MSTLEARVSATLLDKVAEWLTHSALAGDDLENIVRGFCERIAASGLPVARIHLSFSMLHPLYDALGFTWHRSSGVTIDGDRPFVSKERFLQIPYYYQLDNNLHHLCRRLNPGVAPQFPIFEDLGKEKVTDYLA